MFDGNPLEYCTFICAFETVIKAKEPDYAGRLYYLEQHTSGRPQETVRSCFYMDFKEGYLKAKKLLERRFGLKHKIMMSCVDQVTNGPALRLMTQNLSKDFPFCCQVTQTLLDPLVTQAT